MSAIQSLENAILERIRKQEAFKETVKATLTRAFNSLPVCNGKDEVSDTININREKLESLLQKLHNDKSLNKEAVKQLIDRTNIKDLKKGSNSKTGSNLSRSSNSSYQTANGDPLTDPEEEFHFGGKRARTRRR